MRAFAVFYSALFVLIAHCSQVNRQLKWAGKCSNGVDGSTWGIWIDGRDARHGRDAYSSKYSDSMEKSMKMIYEMLEKEAAPMSFELYWKIKEMLHAGWRGYNNPVQSEVRDCHSRVLESTQIREIMQNIVVTDSHYRPLKVSNYTEELTKLFDMYNSKLLAEPNDKLTSIAWLLQNMAFLHPLNDRNGRSRLLMLQYELRRHRLGCGTMMYNNNKNIYFDTLETFRSKIEDGKRAYDEAWKEKFATNPWANHAFRRVHRLKYQNFKRDYNLQMCWMKWCRHNPGCKGTSPLLRRDETNRGEAGNDSFDRSA